MTTVLLSEDEIIIAEFEALAALANVEVIVTSTLNAGVLESCSRLFIDHNISFAKVQEFDRQIREAQHLETALVLTGSPSPLTWRIASIINAKHLVLLPESKAWLIEFLKTKQTNLALTVAFLGATGGVGTSTLALTVAKHFTSEGKRVAVVDLDFTSVGMQIAAGADHSPGLTWSSLSELAVAAEPLALFESMPIMHGVRILANESLTDAVAPDVVRETLVKLQNAADVLVIDAGKWNQSAQLLVDFPCSKFLAVPNTVRACAVAREIYADSRNTDLQLVIREVPGSALNPLAIAQSLKQPLVKVIPNDHRVCELSEQGQILGGGNLTKFNRAIGQLCSERIDEGPLHEAA